MQSKDLLQLVQEFGNPLHAYVAEKIEQQCKGLNNAFAKLEKLHVNYAMKALATISILNVLKNSGSGLDTVSIQRM
jgi:diaminopimelate decarboxylase